MGGINRAGWMLGPRDGRRLGIIMCQALILVNRDIPTEDTGRPKCPGPLLTKRRACTVDTFSCFLYQIWPISGVKKY